MTDQKENKTKQVEKIIFGPDEDVVIPKEYKQKPPRKLDTNGEVIVNSITAVIVILLIRVVLWLFDFIYQSRNGFIDVPAFLFALFLCVIVFGWFYSVTKTIGDYRFRVSCGVSIGTVTKFDICGHPYDSDALITIAFYSFSLPNGKIMRGNVLRVYSKFEDVKIGDRVIVLYNLKDPGDNRPYTPRE
jgi:hypothetical protein